jgi:hypothetical protein
MQQRQPAEQGGGGGTCTKFENGGALCSGWTGLCASYTSDTSHLSIQATAVLSSHPNCAILRPYCLLPICRPLEVGSKYPHTATQMQQLLVLWVAQLVLISAAVLLLRAQATPVHQPTPTISPSPCASAAVYSGVLRGKNARNKMRGKLPRKKGFFCSGRGEGGGGGQFFSGDFFPQFFSLSVSWQGEFKKIPPKYRQKNAVKTTHRPSLFFLVVFRFFPPPLGRR